MSLQRQARCTATTPAVHNQQLQRLREVVLQVDSFQGKLAASAMPCTNLLLPHVLYAASLVN